MKYRAASGNISKETFLRIWIAALLLICVVWGGGSAETPAARDSSLLNRQFQAAVAHYQEHQYAQAEQILNGLLKQVPGNFDLNELMGLVCRAQGQVSRAGGYLAAAVRARPTSAEARMYWAANFVDLHQSLRAEREFKEAVQLEPNNFITNHNLGEYYIRRGNLEGAIPYLRKAQLVNPSAYNNGYDLALAEIKAGDYAGAKAGLERLLHYHSAADLHSLLAEADEKTGEYIRAADEYELAARMEPSEDNVFALGSELLMHHTLAPAAQVFTRGIQLYPHSARMRVGMAVVFYSRGMYSQAIESFCRAIDLSPDDARPYQFLGAIYDVSPLQARAVTERFSRFARLQPRNPQALYYYALSLWKGSENEAKPVNFGVVEGLLERAVALNPSFADAHLQLGILDFRQRRYSEAIEQYHQAIKYQPDLAEAYYRLGEAMVRTGQRPQARLELRTFNRLHEQQTAERAHQRSQIMQFVYTVIPPGKNSR
ncbi:MAG: tetratricopeptide repeat protein [Terriglobia bacterium]